MTNTKAGEQIFLVHRKGKGTHKNFKCVSKKVRVYKEYMKNMAKC